MIQNKVSSGKMSYFNTAYSAVVFVSPPSYLDTMQIAFYLYQSGCPPLNYQNCPIFGKL